MTQRRIGALVLQVVKVGLVSTCMIGLLMGCSSKLQTTTASKDELSKVPVVAEEPEAVIEEEVEAVPQEMVSQPVQEKGPSLVPAMDIPVEEPARPAPSNEIPQEIFATSKTSDAPLAMSPLSESGLSSTPDGEIPSDSFESESFEMPTLPGDQASITDNSQVEDIPVAPESFVQNESMIQDEPMQIAKLLPEEIEQKVEQIEIQETVLERALHDIYFDYDQFVIRDEAGDLLKANAQVLAEELAGAKIVVEGHCDERGTQSYNMVLGKRRAKAVKHFLEDLGIPSDKLQVVSYGKDKPFCTDPTEVCWQENRRGHFVIK